MSQSRTAERSVRIAPSLLSADFLRLEEQIALVESAGADLLHLDIMDGHFVPNLSIGVPVVKSVARATNLFLDTHLMIADPGRYAPAFAEAGSTGITFHFEVAEKPHDLIGQIRGLGCKVGIAINPGTPAESIFEYLDQVDTVLVMTVWPGFGGQKFIESCMEKVAAIAPRLRPEQWLEVDGGIDVETAPRAARAGADTFVAGTAVFGAADPAAAVRQLRRSAAVTDDRVEQVR